MLQIGGLADHVCVRCYLHEAPCHRKGRYSLQDRLKDYYVSHGHTSRSARRSTDNSVAPRSRNLPSSPYSAA
jgi:hypothetical protein